MRVAMLIGLMMFLAGFSYELGLSAYWSIVVGFLPIVLTLVVLGIGFLWERRT